MPKPRALPESLGSGLCLCVAAVRSSSVVVLRRDRPSGDNREEAVSGGTQGSQFRAGKKRHGSFVLILRNSQKSQALAKFAKFGKTDAWLLGCDARPRQTALVSLLVRPMRANHSSSEWWVSARLRPAHMYLLTKELRPSASTRRQAIWSLWLWAYHRMLVVTALAARAQRRSLKRTA